jgi:hypothetical protein
MRRNRSPKWIATIALAAVAALACTATQITSTWRDPGIGPVQLNRVVGVALSQDATLRRLAEDEFVRVVGAPVATAGYAVIGDDEILDRDRARAKLEATDADGVVVFRLVGEEKRERWVPPTYYGSAWGYWGTVAPMVYEPGYLATDRIVRIETNAYRVSDARLVWSARSETLNPSDAEQVIEEVVRAAVEAMRSDGLLPAAATR